MQKNYDAGVDAYYVENIGAGVLVATSKCNFYEGVKFILDQGINPNSSEPVGAGPFNYALSYKNSKIPNLLLARGYKIEHNYKWCLSSKYILDRAPGNIDEGVAKQIKSAQCRE